MPRCKSITRYIPASCAWILLLSATALFFVFPCQYLQRNYHFSIMICQGIVTFFVIANFFLATFMDPGVIKKANPDEDKEDDFRAPLYKNVEINGITVRMKWCTTCQFYRPPRCSHCSVCNTCIETFDHHCPWVNNCIGRRNYRHFFFFLIFLSVHMISIFVWCVLFITDHKDQLHETQSIVTLVIIAIIALLFIPIIGLTGFHIVLVARGRTTNEQVTGKFQGGYNPFSRGCANNCFYTLCGPRFPRPNSSRKSSYAQFHQYNSLSISSGRADNAVRVFLDNTNSFLVKENSRTNHPTNHQTYNKKPFVGRDGAIGLDRIESTSQSQSRDCEPSPPTSPQSRNYSTSPLSPPSNVKPNFSSLNAVHHPHLHHHYPNTHQLQQQHTYPDASFQVTMRRTENGKTETTFPVSPDNSQVVLNSGANAYYMATTNPNLNYYYSQRPTSPSKSTSINEISTQNKAGGPGGMVIYYSPDAGCLTDSSKFCSETALQHLREQNAQQCGGGETSDSFAGSANSSSHFAKRPMSFMKALEMADKLDRQDSHFAGSPKQRTQQNLLDSSSGSNENRQSQYEISV